MNRIYLWCCLLLVTAGSQAQQRTDTLTITLPQAEKIFLQKNLALLAQQYNVDINRALVQQAKYWDNPVLSSDQTLYDGRFFRHKTIDGQTYGQVYLQLQQLIKTAGKRNKLIQLAQDDVLSAQQQFNEVLRNLKYLLTTDFSSLHQLLSTNIIYSNEITVMQKLVAGMEAQWKTGNISEKDNVRIKVLLFSLQSDQADLLRKIADIESELHTLLQQQDTTFIQPVFNDSTVTPVITLGNLLDSARVNRPDLQLAQTNLLSQQHNLRYQQALAVPDVTAGVDYDHINSYVKNYVGLTIGLPLPVLNRNKGNIQAAKASVVLAGNGIAQTQTQLEQDVTAAYRKWLIAQQVKDLADADINDKYDHLLHNMIQSYQQRQVSLLEFIDFFDAYKEAATRKSLQQAALRDAAAEINFTTASNIIPLQ